MKAFNQPAAGIKLNKLTSLLKTGYLDGGEQEPFHGFHPIGTFVMGTVKGDIHDIGKNLVNIMSAFLTATIPMFKVTIEAIKEAGLRDQVKILVGGAPVNQEYADRCGADGFAPDASAAVRLTKELIGLK